MYGSVITDNTSGLSEALMNGITGLKAKVNSTMGYGHNQKAQGKGFAEENAKANANTAPDRAAM